MFESNPLTGKTALVTGASSGIGRATAETLAANGADVALAARTESRLDTAASEIAADHGVETIVVPTDVTDPKQVRTMVDETVGEYDRLDIVVNNAGVNVLEDVDEMSTDQYRTIMGVNVDGMFFTAREAIPHLRESRGNLIFMGSIAGQYPRPHQPVYAATKWWTRGFALSLAGSIGRDGVAVTVLNPTEVLTDIDTGEGKPGREVFDQERSADPADVARSVLFATLQQEPNTVSELDLYSRDKFREFDNS